MTKENKSIKTDETKELNVNVNIFEQDSGMGLENVDTNEMVIPRILLLQDLSPQVKHNHPKSIAGAKPGMFCNSVTKQLYDSEKGLCVVTLDMRNTLIEWADRKKGGGFIADRSDNMHLYDQAIVDDEYKHLTKEGNQLVKYLEFLVFIINDNGSYDPAIMSFSSSQYIHGRMIMTEINQFKCKGKNGYFKPAAFYHTYSIKSAQQHKNDNSWYGYNVSRKCDTIELDDGMNIYTSAKDFVLNYKTGNIKVDSHENVSASDDDPM